MYLDSSPDDDDVESPSPAGVGVDEATDHRSNSGSEEWPESVENHGPGNLLLWPHIGYRASSDGKESCA